MPQPILDHLNGAELAALEAVLVELVDEFEPGEPLDPFLHDALRELLGVAVARRRIRAELATRTGPRAGRARLLDQTSRSISIPGLP